MTNCPFCNLKVKQFEDHIGCASCGKYTIDNPLKEISEEDRTNFAGYLFETNRISTHIKKIVLENDVFKNEVYSSGKVPKTIMQKIDKFIVNLYKLQKIPDQSFALLVSSIMRVKHRNPKLVGEDYFAPISYSKEFDETSSIYRLCIQAGYIAKTFGGKIGFLPFSLTFSGVKRAEELLSTNTDSNQIFIAMKFADPDTGNLREDFINTVKKACQEASNGKLEAKIVQDKEFNDGISDKIKAEIRTSKAVIADYTYENQGVYFEAGYANGLGIPLIRCCEEKWAMSKGGIEKAVHFDERHNNLIVWKSYADLGERLKNRIRNILL
jgi:hypothetical protein